MKLAKKFCDCTLIIVLGIIGGTSVLGVTTAFGSYYGALWLLGLYIALIWTLHKIK